MEHIEIEYKYSVGDKNELENTLKELGGELVFENETQKDLYFTPHYRSFMEEGEDKKKRLRLRTSSDKSTVTYKHYYTTNSAMEAGHCDEYETTVGDIGQMKMIFEALDMKEVVTVEKIRTSYSLDDILVVIDEVTELGTFCEIETKGIFNSVEEASGHLRKVAEKIGFTNEDIVSKGYPRMLLSK